MLDIYYYSTFIVNDISYFFNFIMLKFFFDLAYVPYKMNDQQFQKTLLSFRIN